MLSKVSHSCLYLDMTQKWMGELLWQRLTARKKVNCVGGIFYFSITFFYFILFLLVVGDLDDIFNSLRIM